MWIALALAATVLMVGVYAAEKDTPSAAATRTKKLEALISVDVKEQMLKEIVNDINEQLEGLGLTTISIKQNPAVSLNQRITYKCEKKPLKDALTEMLAPGKLGFIVISTTDKAKLRYDGWIEFRPGDEKGYPADEKGAKVDPKAIAKGEPKEAMKKEAMKKEEPKVAVKEEPKEEPKVVDLVALKKEKLEAAATTYFDLAMTYIDSGKGEKGRAKLMEIIKLFPDTDVAAEAKKQLEEIK